MSANAKTHQILPLRLYLTVGAVLLVLTGITVWVAQQDFGSFNLVVAMAIAAIKASLVALYFMHLRYDSKVYMAVFVGALLFLAVFITLTMADTEARGDVNPIEARPIDQNAVMYDKPAAVDTTHHDTSATTDSTTTTPAAK